MNIKDNDIAVIGMSGKFPGANSVSEFWENICAKRESIRLLSDEELRNAEVPEKDIADSSYVKASALLDDVAMFDPGFFKISPLEAELMDPQIRLLLQCAWETLEDAGHAKKEAQNIGVFAGAGGVATSYFSNFVNVNGHFEKITASPTHLGNDKDFLATYISYKLNLTGPSMTVQTACSTSLVALHQARLSLLSGECDMALAGGVTVRVPHGHGYHYKEGYIFSKSGRVKTFDEGADGVVFGSGLGLVLIKKLSDAIQDGDNVYAVIKGSAIANDGKGKMSYAASSAKGQIACVRAALKNAGVEAGSIGLVEAHGTGTSMGDPEEVKALSTAFKEQTSKKTYCALGAVKTNVGHLEAAAGIVGFIKAVLAVKHGLIPPTVHYAKSNPRIKFENTPFYVNGKLQKWSEGKRPRRAAVNSLGVGGTNAFVILEEYVSAETSLKKALPTPVVVPLSAKSESSLRAYAKRLADFLVACSEKKDAINIEDVAYTLQVGRETMDCRVAFVLSSVDELKAALDRYLQGAEVCSAQGEASGLATSWVNNGDVDWTNLYADTKPRRISLPTYVFARERYWIETGGVVPSRAVIHPLLHTNISDLNEQKYSSSFTGNEFFLKDHQVHTKQRAGSGSQLQKILPGAAYLEMARVAIEQAAPIHYDARVPEFRDIVWLQPIAVSGGKQVNIALVARDRDGQQRIDFEVYTRNDHIHFQGRCVFASESARDRLDPARLKDSMARDQWSADSVYAAFAKMGLDYGPAHRAIIAIDRGERELLAQLKLPLTVEASQPDYVLHPSLIDGALQAATALLFDLNNVPSHPIVPFAIESLRVIAPCAKEMLAWVRYSQGAQPSDKSAKLDVDLLDKEGNVGVQIRGFVPRSLGQETLGSLLATQVWQPSNPAATQATYTERHVVLCDLPHVDASKIARDCSLLQIEKGKNIAERYSDLALACFEKVQALVKRKPQSETFVQVVIPNTDENAAYAGLSGLFKTVRLENPQIAGQLVFVDVGVGTDELMNLLHAECSHPHDTLIKYEQGVRHISSWQFLKEDDADTFDGNNPYKDQGVYLITGGLGGLGVVFAKEILARTSNAKIVLSGRAPPSEVRKSASKKAVLESLQAGGATVEYRQLDLDDPNKVKNLIAAIQKKYKQLNGIIHSAGMTSDGFILKKTAADVGRVLAPKVLGTFHLDQATQDVDLDFLVLFSSLTSAVGNLGQADYAAANGFMDEFAAYRNRLANAGKRRGFTLSIRWPLWQDGGMQPDAAGREMLQETTGICPMQTSVGIRMFYRSLASRYDQTLVMEGDLHLMQRTLGVGAAIHAATPAVDVPKLEFSSETEGEDRGGRSLTELTEAYLCKQLSASLKLPAHKVDPRAPLEDYGIDSILALGLTSSLEKTFGSLPKTLFFEYLTVRELAGYFVKAHVARLSKLFSVSESGSGQESMQVSAQALAPAQQESISSVRFGSRRFIDEGGQPVSREVAPSTNDPIAIIGLSGRYPEARNLKDFWRNLREGKDCIVEVPKGRWDWRDYYSEDRSEKGRHYSKWGGFIEGVDEFDARFFNISPVEAETIDPQERLFLQHAWMAIEDAGYTRAALQIPKESDLAGQVGVYAGVMYGEYQLFGAEVSLQGNRVGFASNLASIANRVSYVMNLHGPSMVVDTMCSSSLTAIHLACQDLKLGRTSLGIAGGVNVTIHPNKYLMLSAGQFISSDGHCQSFGEGGEGYIPGEGVGVVVLKRRSEAERDGNHIYGIIRGSALSHGGKTNGYTVPNPQAQARAIRLALAEAGIDPRHISYVEAHGTGTKLGDPIEIAALSKVFQESTQDTGFCLIGSAKSNIGHCEAAAGIAGLTKVLLQLKHKHIVPSLHSARLNPHIDFDSTPFIVNQALRPWEQPVVDGKRLPRIAGISSFGAGGANAHLIVEEYPQPVVAVCPQADVEYIFPLSARTAEQLREKARDLLDFIRGEEPPLPLASIAYTLEVGREAMDERLAVLADSVATLADRLQAYLDGHTTTDDVYQGQVKANKDTLSLLTKDPDLHATIGKWIADRKLSKLADLWVKGLELDWRKFHVATPALISLPTYPFAKQRFWIDAAVAARRAPQALSAALHPLLHSNTSDFSQQSYAATFGADEFFLTGAPGRRCLTEAAYLEMARAAIDASMPARKQSSILELRDVAWAQPGVIVDNRPVMIALFDKLGEQVTFEIYSAGGVDGAGDIVHCQGRAARSDQPAGARLDIAAIAVQEGRALIELRLPTGMENGQDDYVLHPALMQSALQAAGLTSSLSQPFAMASLRVVFPSTKAKFAWVRHSASAERAIDIDLCDEHGHVCVQMRGLHYGVSATHAAEAPAERASIEEPKSVAITDSGSAKRTAQPTRVRFDTSSSIISDAPILEKLNHSIALKAPGASLAIVAEHAKASRIRFAAPQAAFSDCSILGKPNGSILLMAPDASPEVEAERGASAKPRVLLSPPIAGMETPEQSRAASSVGLFDYGNGVFAIRIGAAVSRNTLSADLIENVLRAMRTVEDASSAKVLTIEGSDEHFLAGGLEQHRDAVASKLYSAIAEFPYPVIAVVRNDAVGAGFLAAAVSDFMVCSDSARYAFALPEEGLYPSAAEDILIERFGRAHATDFLYMTTGATGAELKAKGWTCPIMPRDQVAAYAQDLAANLAKKSQISLRLLKQHLARHIASAVKALPTVDGAPFAADAAKPGTIKAPSVRLQLDAHGERALVVRIRAQADGSNAKDLLADLEAVFAKIDDASPYRCVVLASELVQFLPDVAEDARADVAQGFRKALLALDRPIVAALNGDATGIAWYVVQFCDACVYSEQGRYSGADILRDPALAGDAAAVFSLRFDDEAAKQILLVGAEASGVELRADYGALHVLGADQVFAGALELADALAAFPTPVLSAWKQRTASFLTADTASLGDESMRAEEGAGDTADAAVGAPVAVALESTVISAIAHPEGVLEVHMADRDAKNMFSDAFSRGMREVFAHVEENRAYKVVVITGYDNYFSSGGTQDTLLAIHEGKARFTDNKVFQLPLTCTVPVIAAMQGHGVGAGWAMGMYADFALFSDESRYLSPYMGYGFTPGAGSTLMFPEKTGYDLARETLLTAQEYSGGELKDRGLRNPVLPRERVLPAAMALARRIAQGSRGRLVVLKRRWAHVLQASLQDTFDRELAMHERTFVGQADTLARIQGGFGAEAAAQTVAPQQPASLPAREEDLCAITASLKQMLAHELRMQEHEIGEGEQFVDLGLDSITGVTWIRRINQKYGTSIEAIKVYSYPTLTQLSRYVREEAEKAGAVFIAPQVHTPVVPIEVPAARPVVTSLASWRDRSRSKAVAGTASAAGPIAVIGMAGQFAKARDLEEFWQNIAQGKDCIEEIPKHRWDIDLYYQEGEVVPGKTYSKWMGFLEEYDLFDAAFFNISPREARSMDPQQRLFLQACWHSIEHAGYNPKSLSGSKCGVFVGCSAGDYHQLSKREQLSGQGFTGAAPSILAARISYFLDLHGPSLSIDSACSSSLVVIASACDSLVSGASDIALAGGVNVMCGPAMQIMTAQVGMLSPQGRCFTFDERANGIANGEGVGVVMLKRLADAERDRDWIYGVVEGWGVNQDGKTNGITAPNADSQTRLQQEVYDKFRIDPAGIQLIEAHGTGTALGDPIEVAGLKASFGKYTRNKDYCALGSVKSNIGHCLTAAGVSGFLKILLALKHEQLPPTIHFSKLNKHISLQDSPFYVNDRLREWKHNGTEPRRAAINAFGFSGTNAHAVIAEYRSQQDIAAPRGPAIVPLSARTPEQLKHKGRDLLAFIRAQSASTLYLDRIAYTLQVGREAMNERAAFIAGTVAELESKLEAFVESEDTDGGPQAAHVYRGQVSSNKDTLLALSSDTDFQTMIAKWISRKELPRLADLWAKGLALDWNAFHAAGDAPRRIGLPVYPFAKERYWIDAASDERIVLTGHANAAIHPLLHANTSDLSRQKYSTTLNGDEFFLIDCDIPGGGTKRVLPASACLEMARAAVENAVPGLQQSEGIELCDVEWGQPVEVGQISIALSSQRDGSVAFEIFSGEQEEVVHCQGAVALRGEVAPSTLDLALLQGRIRKGGQTPENLYDAFAKSGVRYGVVQRAIHEIHTGDDELLVRLVSPAAMDGSLGDYRIHPSLMDSAIQAGIVLLGDPAARSAKPLSPATINSVNVVSACAEEVFAWVRRSAADRRKADIDLCDRHGNVCVQVRGLALQALTVVTPRPADTEVAPARAQPAPPVFQQTQAAVRPATTDARPSISQEQLQQQLKASLAEALFMKPFDVDVNKSFTELGLDSIIGVEWVKTINKQYGTGISATRVYDYPSVKELAAYLQVEIGGAVSGSLATVAVSAVAPIDAPEARPAAEPAISREALQLQLKASLADALFMKPSDVDVNKSFTELGLDSIIGVEWVKTLNKQYCTNISATRVYDYPSIKELASFLIGEMAAIKLPQSPASAPLATVIAQSDKPSPRAETAVQGVSPPPRAKAAFAGRTTRFSRLERIRFEPKYARNFKDLYFYSPYCHGDFEAEGEFSVQCAINPETNVSLKEHVVFDEHLLPTDAYIELVYSAYRTYFSAENVCLKNIAIVNPILGEKGRDNHIRVVFRRAGDDLQFFVKSSLSPDFLNDKLHMQGFVSIADKSPATRFDDGFAIENELGSAEIPTNTGTYYAPLQALRFGESSAVGLISVPGHDFKFLASPFVLYGGLCTVINYGAYLAGRHHGISDDQFLPHRIGNIAVLGSLNESDYRCYAEVRKLERDSVEFYFEIVDRAGKPMLVVDSISLRRVARKTIQQQAAAAKTLPVIDKKDPSIEAGAAAEKIAIIGMSCRYPMSENVDTFWENLKAGKDCVIEVPADRWGAYSDWYHPDPRHPHTSYSKWSGFLDSIDTFDALFFGISPAEAELIDPQQRIFLEECWKTIESAGYAPSTLSNSPCGVYVGCSMSDYGRVLATDGQDTAGAAFMGTSSAILAARISYYLNLKGPALALDTACSSSLVAVHLACESIRSGENQLALAGGINLLATPFGHILTSQVGMLSRDGRCAAFDATANGIVFSEGCGVLLLKALSAAKRDNDNILGVIQGSGSNQDGKTNGITAPSSKAQEQLLQQVYTKFGIDTKRISYVEAHGTATPLGDPIEFNALTSVFGKATTDRKHCTLGSVKSNIGHTGFAAGVAGVVKVLLCIKHRKLVPSIHYSQPNPHIEFEKSPFYVNTEYRDWESEQPRLAAVSAFGFSGTNAHVVIEEHVPSSEPVQTGAAPDGKVLVPLSAKAAEQLQQKVRDLLDFIGNQEQPVDLARLAYTLQVGRDAMDHRLGLIVGSVDQLAEKLQAWLDAKVHIEDVYRGQPSHGDDTLAAFAGDAEMRNVIERWIARKDLPKVVDLWVRGFDLDWNKLHEGTKLRRMILPTYPFARERCWVDGATSRKPIATGNAAALLHPLLHRNTSDLSQQSYTSTFGGDEFFLADHRVNGQPVLPAVAYLEMARAALMDAMPAEKASLHLELRHVVWAQPIVVTDKKSVTIAVFSENEEQVDFEVYSPGVDGTDEVLHCQGSCVFGGQPAAPKLDLGRLRTQMSRGSLEGAVLYPTFATMGLNYGPAFRGLVAIHQGENQLLVELSLPDAARKRGGNYVLHPSLMDSALQGSITLIDDVVRASGKLSLPFALESLRIVSLCSDRMVAWVRYSQGAPGASSNLIKVDIDLCDPDGNVCVQMQGFSSRPMENVASFDEAYYQSIIAGILSNEISVDEAVELGNL